MLFETKPCPYCGDTSQIPLDDVKVKRWQDGELIQNVWPELNSNQRELLISGTCAPCWDEMFGDEDE